MDKDFQSQWERFLTPKILRSNMITATVYIAAFEILKNSIIGRIRDFFWTDFDENGDIIDPRYESEVLSKKRSPLYASMEWLKDMDAISEEDVALFDKAKDIRNKVAHEINGLLVEGLPPDLPENFENIVKLLDKIERWWIVNVELEINPQLADKEIDAEEIVPGPVLNLKMMIDIALGSDEQAEIYIKEFTKNMKSN